MNTPSDNLITDAFAHCIKIARKHYENFPVASFLIPRRLRKHVAAVYAFARYADDIADEGIEERDHRLTLLNDWKRRLIRMERGELDHPVFIALADTLKRFHLPIQLFHDLLDAFAQDILVQEYDTFDQVLDYCRRSANPIGRLMLLFFKCSNEHTIPAADALCTGLQLANFWQDITIDIQKPRIYLPRKDRIAFGVGEDDLMRSEGSIQFRNLIQFEVNRTRDFFEQSRKIFSHVPFRLRLELKAIWRGGIKILDEIASKDFDTLAYRPQLNRFDKISILLSSMLPVPQERLAYARH